MQWFNKTLRWLELLDKGVIEPHEFGDVWVFDVAESDVPMSHAESEYEKFGALARIGVEGTVSRCEKSDFRWQPVATGGSPPPPPDEWMIGRIKTIRSWIDKYGVSVPS